MHPRNLSIEDFTYVLPEDRIAKYPLPQRDASKLLIYKHGRITEDIYRNLDQYLPANSLIIFNDTKVIEARILFQKSTGGVVEIFCLEPHEQYADITTGMMQKGKILWQCMIGGASKWKHGQVLEKKIRTHNKEVSLLAKYVEKRPDSFVIEFSWSDGSMSFAEILHNAGAIPLPPYIKRKVENLDAERYQTIYAHYQGSVAAPTAGLHFTDDLMQKLKRKKIESEFVTLHVGAGTFKPVKSKTLDEHEMHSEFISISRKAIENILNNLPGNIVAVGTTSLRTIESLYWLGLKIKAGEKNNFKLSQWDPYELKKDNATVAEALEVVLEHMNKTNRNNLDVKTQIIIAPSYEVRIARALVTNFHQPQSTLLLLVAGLVGGDWKKIYTYALENDYRFLSYGDGCLLWINHAGTGEMTG
jgi:S-adenosylmethionine:tRNA ribosyltransferase-isomerase